MMKRSEARASTFLASASSLIIGKRSPSKTSEPKTNSYGSGSPSEGACIFSSVIPDHTLIGGYRPLPRWSLSIPIDSYSESWAEVRVSRAKGLRRVARPLHPDRSEEHTSELQSRGHLVCRLLLEKKKEIVEPAL